MMENVQGVPIRMRWKDGAHMRLTKEEGVPFLTFPSFEGVPGLLCGATTRFGGVSQGFLSSMNLSFVAGGDDPENVRENYRRAGKAMGFTPDQVVATRQTHSSIIKRVTEETRGNGITRPQAFEEVDGLVTDAPQTYLAVFMADCVPLLFVDPKHHAVGACHSGWKGTVQKIGAKTIQVMAQEFGSEPGELLAGIGPSICQDCYEVGEELREQFLNAFTKAQVDSFFAPGREVGKYQLSLWEANRQVLLEAGIREGNLSLPGVCTCCNKDFLFSHRGSQGKRGLMAVFLGWRV